MLIGPNGDKLEKVIYKEIYMRRKMIGALHDGKRFKYWWYKRKYNKLKRKEEALFSKRY